MLVLILLQMKELPTDNNSFLWIETFTLKVHGEYLASYHVPWLICSINHIVCFSLLHKHFSIQSFNLC